MIEIDWSKYTSKQYDDDNYDCLHFACELYNELTGISVDDGVFTQCQNTGKRIVNPTMLRRYQPLQSPKSPCFVVMHRVDKRTHAGVYIDGCIVHLTKNGLQYLPPHLLATNYPVIHYYDQQSRPSDCSTQLT